MPINFLKMTPREMILYWRECLNDLGKSSAYVEVASRMVSVIGSDYFDDVEVEADGVTQSDFSKLFELALALEWDYKSDDKARAGVWREIERLLVRLEERYLND